jgi:hypothetical protein
MLINYIRVFQQSGAPSNIVGQSEGGSNLTGAGGPVGVGNGGRGTLMTREGLGLGVMVVVGFMMLV